MSHVDDGILHAYLDGALDALSDAGELPGGATASDVVSHLGSCADCRARLEAERAIREGAGIVLGEAAPAPVAAPPMPVPAAPRRRRRMGWVPLSWAATVLLALGGGWWGSELWRAQRMSTAAVEQAESRLQRTESHAQRSDVAPTADAVSTAPSGRTASDRPAATSRAEAGAVEPDSPASLAGEPLPVDARSAASLANETPPAESRSAASAGEPLGTESRMASVPAAPQPIGALPADRPAVAGPEQISARAAQNALVPQGVPLRQPPTAGSGRPRQSVVAPESSAMVRPWAVDAAGLKTVAGDFSGLAAFDSISALDQSGALRFTAASASELVTMNAHVFLVAHASEPAIEVAHGTLGTVVRVQQTLPSGEDLELISWRPHAAVGEPAQQAIALESVVITGAAVREAQLADARRRVRAAEAQPDSAADTMAVAFEPVGGVRTLEDGRDQLVLRSASADVWLALRGRLTVDELHALVSGLRQHPLR